MRRAILLQGIGKELEISKVTKITNLQNPQREFIYFDQLDDGTWRLIYAEDTISDFTQIEAFKFIREN
jgi:hypothetical protein